MNGLSCEVVEKALVALTLNPRELSAAERSDILAQVDGCEGCRELYEDYVRISAGLLHAVPARVPPPALKASLMERVRQSAPVAAPSPAPITPAVQRSSPARNLPVEKRPGFLENLWDWLTGSAGVPRIGFGLAAVLLAAAAGVAFTQMRGQIAAQNAQLIQQQAAIVQQQTTLTQQQTQLAQQQQQMAGQQQMLAILADPGAQAVRLSAQKVAPNAQARLQFNPASNTAILSLDGLPALEASQQYQLWLFDASGKPLPSTAFDATAKNVVINAEAKFGGYINFAVSVEPKGGSKTPTGPIALIANS